MKMPPIEKVYEAWSALADGRVKIDPESTVETGKALVGSSDDAKEYTVTWREGDIYTSNDNATYWQLYPGYPIIAVLMLQHRLPEPSAELLAKFGGINWNAVNKAAKGNYAKAFAEAAAEAGIPVENARSEAETVMSQLSALPLSIKRGSLRPPK